MKKQDEKIPGRPFTAGFLADDLIDWAGKLLALGAMLCAISESKDTTALELYGEPLGSIIMDYAELIKTAVDENVGQVNGSIGRLDHEKRFEA